MRYYHPFPEAIPLSEAGCSRVTHPSATKNAKQAKHSPFDLHVLGVPPAFVLSQDQTLHKIVSLSWINFMRIISFSSLLTNRSQLLFIRFIVLSDFSKYNAVHQFLDVPNWPRVPVLFLPFLILALFSFQDAVFVVSLSRSFRFSLAATYSLYHILGSLSSLFSKFFWETFCFPLDAVFRISCTL